MDNVTKLKVDNKLGPTRMSGVTFFGSFPPNKRFGLKSKIQQSLVCRTSLLVRLLVGQGIKKKSGIWHKEHWKINRQSEQLAEWPPHLKKKRLLCLILLGEHLCKFAFSFLIDPPRTPTQRSHVLSQSSFWVHFWSGVTFFGSFPPNKLFSLKSVIQQGYRAWHGFFLRNPNFGTGCPQSFVLVLLFSSWTRECVAIRL